MSFLFEFVTCCVQVKYVSLTAVKIWGWVGVGGSGGSGGEVGANQCLPDYKCFHSVLYPSI